MKKLLALSFFTLLTSACSQTPQSNEFNIKYSFGVEGGHTMNVLDTEKDTFTQDRVVEDPLTVDLVLSEEEMKNIQDKLASLDLESEPEPSTIVSTSAPCSIFEVEIQENGETRTAEWNCSSETKTADRAEFENFMWNLIEAQEEFQSLPPLQGGYM